MKFTDLRGPDLLLRGSLALSKAEEVGIQLDMEYVRTQYHRTEKKIQWMEDEFSKTPVGSIWKNRFGPSTNWNSDEQLAEVLFRIMKLTPPKMTERNKPSVDKESLSQLQIEELDRFFLPARTLKKVRGTYLSQFLREADAEGRIHPTFSLHVARTYRSSSEGPNFQNNPVRDEISKKIVRKCFLPSKGNRLLEVDYSGIEVKISACYHKDPVMLEYLHDSSKDMHRDTAMDCYLLPKEEVSKNIRYCGKNKFVFPQFYGDYYKNCAHNLWEAIDRMNLETVSGVPVKKHLKSKGIRSYSDFEAHIKRVEEKFWGERFRVYAEWKERWWKRYLAKGYFDTFTGFRCRGVMERNQVINYPVQGSAFHCLLWSLIMITDWMEERRMRSRIVGQIHDSILFDVVPEEFDELVESVNRIMTVELKKVWDWIVVPIEIEAEACEPDQSWYYKKEVPLPSAK